MERDMKNREGGMESCMEDRTGRGKEGGMEGHGG